MNDGWGQAWDVSQEDGPKKPFLPLAFPPISKTFRSDCQRHLQSLVNTPVNMGSLRARLGPGRGRHLWLQNSLSLPRPH